MAKNQGAWLDGANQKLRVADADMPECGEDEILVRNRAIAVNPVDWKIQDYGVFVQKWPMLLGTDVAGEVVSTGANVKRFKTGDRVAGHTISLATNDPGDGGFQLYSKVKAGKAAVLPDSISFSEGSVIPLALDTAAVGLLTDTSNGGLGLSYPSLEAAPTDKTIFVWGGSSSVGTLVTQLAVASGAKVVTTASKHNFDFCKKNGASEVIDYKSANVIDQVTAAIQKVGGKFVGVYDAISVEDQSFKHVLPILEKLGGGSLCVVLQQPENPPKNVRICSVFGINEITHKIWEDYVTSALKKGDLKCLPEPMSVGKGLENVQKGLDESKKGVSAKKVIIELD